VALDDLLGRGAEREAPEQAAPTVSVSGPPTDATSPSPPATASAVPTHAPSTSQPDSNLVRAGTGATDREPHGDGTRTRDIEEERTGDAPASALPGAGNPLSTGTPAAAATAATVAREVQPGLTDADPDEAPPLADDSDAARAIPRARAAPARPGAGRRGDDDDAAAATDTGTDTRTAPESDATDGVPDGDAAARAVQTAPGPDTTAAPPADADADADAAADGEEADAGNDRAPGGAPTGDADADGADAADAPRPKAGGSSVPVEAPEVSAERAAEAEAARLAELSALAELEAEAARLAELEAEAEALAELEAEAARLAELEAQTARLRELEEQARRVTELEAETAHLDDLQRRAARVAELEAQASRLPYLEAQARRVAELEAQVSRMADVEAAAERARRQRAQSLPRAAEGAPGSVSELVQAFLARADELFGVGDTGEVIVSAAVEQTGAEAAALLLPDGGRWRVAAGHNVRPLERRIELTDSSWLITQVAWQRRGVIVEDTDIARRALRGAPLASWHHLLAAPVPGVQGLLVLARSADPAFGERDLSAMVALAREAAPPYRRGAQHPAAGEAALPVPRRRRARLTGRRARRRGGLSRRRAQSA
jgi:hypothetical protein